MASLDSTWLKDFVSSKSVAWHNQVVCAQNKATLITEILMKLRRAISWWKWFQIIVYDFTDQAEDASLKMISIGSCMPNKIVHIASVWHKEVSPWKHDAYKLRNVIQDSTRGDAALGRVTILLSFKTHFVFFGKANFTATILKVHIIKIVLIVQQQKSDWNGGWKP